MMERGMNERLMSLRNPIIAAGAAAAGLALASCGQEQSLGPDQAAELIKQAPIGRNINEDGMNIGRYDPMQGHPEYTLWGIVQYCDKPGGRLVQIILDQRANKGDPADVTDMTRAVFVNHKKECQDGKIEEHELPKPPSQAPGNGS
jgi:hypothetical protein